MAWMPNGKGGGRASRLLLAMFLVLDPRERQTVNKNLFGRLIGTKAAGHWRGFDNLWFSEELDGLVSQIFAGSVNLPLASTCLQLFSFLLPS